MNLSHCIDFALSFSYRIGPFDVESALIEHPAVEESAVVSSPDEERGQVSFVQSWGGLDFPFPRSPRPSDDILILQVVKAFIVRTKEYMDKDENELIVELQNFVKEMTAPYKYPRKVRVLGFFIHISFHGVFISNFLVN